MQETHTNSENELKWKSKWGGVISFSHGLSNGEGVMILFKKELHHTVHSVQTRMEGG